MELRGALEEAKEEASSSKAILPPVIKVGWEEVCEGQEVVDTIASLKDTQEGLG